MDLRRHDHETAAMPSANGRVRRRQRRQRRVGATLLSAAVIGAIIAPLTSPVGAVAQEAPEPVPAEVAKEAYFTQSGGAVVPDTLVREFPPGVICVVRPEACRQELEPVTDPINDGLQSNPPEEVVPEEPQQPVMPGTLPTGVQGGNPRYVSYLALELPEVPEGKEIDTFELILHQEGVNYRQDSPAFREAVEAAILCATQRTQPVCEKEFRDTLASQPMRSGTDSPFAIESCLVLGEWEGGPNQEYAEQPERDCIVYASTGKFDEETEMWTFDISFIVDAWLSGAYPNHGLYFGPLSAENLAFGDRDTSANAQLSFGGKEGEVPPQIRYTLTDAYVPPPPPPPPTTGTTGETTTGTDGTSGSGTSGTTGSDGSGTTGITTGTTGDSSSSTGVTTGTSGTSSTGSTGFTSGSSTTSGSGGTSGGVYAPPPNLPGEDPPAATTGGEPGPEVAPDPEGGTTGAPPPPGQAVAGATQRPYTPWWVWLLIPLGLAGLYYLARSLAADPEVILDRPGAMTRLIERQQANLAQTPALQV